MSFLKLLVAGGLVAPALARSKPDTCCTAAADGVETIPLEVVPASYDLPHPGGLGKCQGSCTTNEHCEGNLACFSPSFFPVPGCTFAKGWERPDNVGYCYNPDDTPERVNRASCEGLLGRCEGDCDSDNDCLGPLVCESNGKQWWDPPPKGAGDTQGPCRCAPFCPARARLAWGVLIMFGGGSFCSTLG